MLSPLSRGYGTWTGNYDPYNDDGGDSESLPEIEEPHRHGITVGFISRTPTATSLSSPCRTSSSHHGREATLSGKRVASGRGLSPVDHNTDSQMNLPKTYLTKKGALVLFTAPEDEDDWFEERPRFMISRKQTDLIDTSLKLGTLDKLAMSVLEFGEEDSDQENISVSDEKKQLFMKFLNKVDERDVDERAQPGGDVRYYLTDLKNRTSMQMGLSGESSLPRSREALELRAILRGLQNDSWPMKYKQEGADFRQPSALAYQFSRPPSHLHHPPRNQYQRILSSQKLEDSVVSLKSYLGRTLDTLEEGHVPILTRRRGRFKNGSDVDSAKRSKYSRERTDDDLRKKMRPHTNTPTQVGGTVVNISKEEDNKSMVEDEHGLDAKSSARDDGYYSISHISQSDNCSFILGPRNWTPVNSQAPVDEIVQPKTPTIDIKKMVDKGSTHLGDESSLDDGLDGEGIVVGLAQGSDDSDVEIIYSHTDVPDNTLEAMEISDSYKTSFKANSIKSVSSDIFKNEDSLVEGDNSIASSKIQSAIVSQRTVSRSKSRNFSVDNLSNEDKDLNLDSSYSKSLLKFETDNIGNNVVATSCDDENYNTDPEFIASDGEDIDDLIENENEITLVSNEKDSVSHSEINERAKSRTLSSASSHKRSRTPSSMHSFAQDDDQSSVTILPHDQELISVDVRSSKSRQSDKSQNNAHDMEQVAPVIGQIAQEGDFTIKVKDTESVLTGDDATSVVMSMGEDTSTVMDVLRDLHGDDEERDKLGEIIDPRFPMDDRGRIDMIDNEDLNLHFTKTSTPFPPPTPTNESLSSARNNLSPIKDELTLVQISNIKLAPYSSQKSFSSSVSKMVDTSYINENFQINEIDQSTTEISQSALSDSNAENISKGEQSIIDIKLMQKEKLENTDKNTSQQMLSPIYVPENIDSQEIVSAESANLKVKNLTAGTESSHLVNTESNSEILIDKLRDESGSLKSIEPIRDKIERNVLVSGDNSDTTNPDVRLDDSAEIPHPSTPRSTEIATEDKVSPRVKSESSSKLGEKVEETMDPETMVSVQGDTKLVKTKTEYPVIPDFLKPKPPPKGQQKKDLKKKGQVQKGGKKGGKTGSKDVTKAIDITSVQPEEPVDEITQIIRKKVTLPPEKEHSVIPDFVSEAIKRSAERSKLQLEKEYREQQELISKEIGDTLFEGQEGMTAEELELAKKALKEKEEMTKEKLLKGKQQKKVDEKSRKSGGSSSIKSKKSKGAGGKDPLQLEKERIRELKELEKQQRLEEIKALEARIQAANEGLSAEEKKFKDKLLEVQLELDRIEREAHMADQTEADVRQALKEDRMKRMEDKARQKKEELARKRQMQLEKKQQERQLKEEARQRELQKIMMLMDDEERRRRQEEEKQRQLKEEEEEEKRRKEEEEEMARLDREEEERRRQLEEEIEQEQLKRLQEEQDELRRQQEAVAAQKQALLEEQRRQRELAALEEQRYMEELERRKREEMKKIAEDKARMQELQKLEEDVRESMRRDMELRKENAIKRREYNIEAKSNLNKIKHSQGITRAWVWSYFIQWPMDTYMRPVGEQEKKKKEAKLREKRKKAR